MRGIRRCTFLVALLGACQVLEVGADETRPANDDKQVEVRLSEARAAVLGHDVGARCWSAISPRSVPTRRTS